MRRGENGVFTRLFKVYQNWGSPWSETVIRAERLVFVPEKENSSYARLKLVPTNYILKKGEFFNFRDAGIEMPTPASSKSSSNASSAKSSNASSAKSSKASSATSPVVASASVASFPTDMKSVVVEVNLIFVLF